MGIVDRNARWFLQPEMCCTGQACTVCIHQRGWRTPQNSSDQGTTDATEVVKTAAKGANAVGREVAVAVLMEVLEVTVGLEAGKADVARMVD